MSFDQLIFHPLQTNPLFEPVRNRDITEIKRLLDMGANPRDTWVSITPFGNAIESGYSEGVKLMTTYMKPLPSDVLFEIGQIDTNLVERKVEMLSLLISLGARFDHIGGRLTALHYVIQVSPALVRIILDEYPQLVNDCGTSSRNPPLSYAIGNIWETGDDLHGLRETVFLLLERGADPNHLPRTEISFPISLLFIRNYQKYHDEGGKIQEDILKKLLECGSQLPWLQRLTPKKQRFALELLSKVYLRPLKFQRNILLFAAREKNPESPFHRDVFPLDLLRIVITFVSEAYERDLSIETGVIQDSTDQIPDGPVKKRKVEFQNPVPFFGMNRCPEELDFGLNRRDSA